MSVDVELSRPGLARSMKKLGRKFSGLRVLSIKLKGRQYEKKNHRQHCTHFLIHYYLWEHCFVVHPELDSLAALQTLGWTTETTTWLLLD